jgi:hypothetical protein
VNDEDGLVWNNVDVSPFSASADASSLSVRVNPSAADPHIISGMVFSDETDASSLSSEPASSPDSVEVTASFPSLK